MKKLLTFLLLSLSAFATTTVTGHVLTLGTGNVTSGAYVRFWLRGCAGNQPRVSSSGAIAPTQGGVFYFDFPVSSSGTVSGTLYSTRDNAGTGNGDIECGGSFTSVWYGMQVFVGGKGGPEVAVHAKSGATLDIANVFPLTTTPVTTAPAGDVIYLRLDGRNSPVTGPVSFSDSITVKNQGNFGGNGLSGQQSQYFTPDINGQCADYDQSGTFDQFTDVNSFPKWVNQTLNTCFDILLGKPFSTTSPPPTGSAYGTDAAGLLQLGTTLSNPLNPPLIGPKLAPRCLVDGVTFKTLAACINYLKGLGLQGGVIDDFMPEDFTVSPFRQAFAAQVNFGTGYNSTTCDSTHVNCWVTEVPLILPTNTKLRGSGRVSFGNNLSAGTVFINGNNHPAPHGIPTEGAMSCAASGGFLSNGTYFVQVSTVNNLQTAVSSALPVVGTSFPTTEVGVVCANGGANQSIAVPSPSAAGSGSFVAQDYYVYASATTGTEVQQPILANNFSCATPGVLDTTTCKMTSAATIKAIQTGTQPVPVVDTTNAMMVESGQQSQGAVTFSNDLRDISLHSQFQGVNSPNVVLYNTSQELSGVFGLHMSGTPGGYTAASFGPAAGIYNSNLNLNSRYEHIHAVFSTNAGTLYPMIVDGRDGGGQANGSARSIHDATFVARTSGVTAPAQVWVLGTNPGNAVVGLSDVHMEGVSGSDCLLVDQGAKVSVTSVMCGAATAYTVHVSSTGGGVVVSSVASGQNRALKDDLCGWTFNVAFVTNYQSPCVGSSNIPRLFPTTVQRSESAADTNLLTITPQAAAGTYAVCFSMTVSAANAATLGWTATWKDVAGVAQSPTHLPLTQISSGAGDGAAAPALTFTTSTASNYSACHTLEVDSSATPIVVKLTFTGTSFSAKASATVTRMN